MLQPATCTLHDIGANGHARVVLSRVDALAGGSSQLPVHNGSPGAPACCLMSRASSPVRMSSPSFQGTGPDPEARNEVEKLQAIIAVKDGCIRNYGQAIAEMQEKLQSENDALTVRVAELHSQVQVLRARLSVTERNNAVSGRPGRNQLRGCAMRDAVTATEDEHGTNMITRVDATQEEKDLLTTELTQALKRIEAMTRQYESTIQDHAKTCLEKDNAAKQYISQITKLENKLASVSVLKFEASARAVSDCHKCTHSSSKELMLEHSMR